MTDFTFLLKTIRFVSIVFHIITARSTQPDNESKGKEGKKCLFAHKRHCDCATTGTGSGGLAICSFWISPERLFSPGALVCLSNHLKSYTERIKHNKIDGSFQSSRGASQRVGAWWVCAPRNRWKQSGLTHTEVSVTPESWLRMG
ncbi:hypothetical protein ILYODFUR_033823 [Ilyodon furcidens]|uniref:Secreted protein n=1 Tax=Ilyodon furcidens TaxID=33524 RepID=A0ABV0U3S3_9TELE